MTIRSPFRDFKTSPEVIRLAVMLYVQFPRSLRNVVDHEGKVLESYVRNGRDRKASLKSQRNSMRRVGAPKSIVTDKLRSYGAAMKVIGNAQRQETGRWLNSRVENFHLPFRRHEPGMLRFRQMRSLQKFVALHVLGCNHLNQEHRFNARLT